MDIGEFTRRLQAIVGQAAVLEWEPLAHHTTFRIGGPAQWLVQPSTEGQIVHLVQLASETGMPLRVMGLGSNLLVSDDGLSGIVLKLGGSFSAITVLEDEMPVGNGEPSDERYPAGGKAPLKSKRSRQPGENKTLENETGDHGKRNVRIFAQAGASNADVAAAALDAGLAGYEFASGIPGSIGGAAIMNAGAYGGEFKDVASSIRVLTCAGDIRTIPVEEARLSYRHSLMMDDGSIVLGATLALRPDDREVIAARMDDLRQRREAKQPLNMPSVGSTFKRPEGYFAGKLIEDAGLRGFAIGGAQVSPKHCGFVVNTGCATARDVCELIAHVRQQVSETAGVELQPEVRFWGFEEIG